MKIFLWQNIISPHQASLITALKDYAEVTLIVENAVDAFRRAQGWEGLEDVKGIKIVDLSSSENVGISFNKGDSHIFSGLKSYPKISSYFEKAVSSEADVFIYSEMYDIQGIKGFLRSLKIRWNIIRYRSKIKGLLAIGTNAVAFFEKIGFPRNKIYEVGYHIGLPSAKAHGGSLKDEINICFVGRLVKCKGLIEFINELEKVNFPKISLTIIGDGPLLGELKECQSRLKKVKLKFTGALAHEKVLLTLCNHDVLVLPNTGKEGWGVVVNEALHCGVPVICSKLTGSFSLVESESVFGYILDEVSKEQIELALQKLKEIKLQPSVNKSIRELSYAKVGSTKAAEYFINIIQHASGNQGERPIRPW